MPLTVALQELRRELRAETGTSLNPAQGVQAQGTMDVVLARQQRELWDAYNWQHLKTWVDVPLADNQALYSYPVQMAFDQVAQMWIATASRAADHSINGSSSWQPLVYGVKPHMMKLGPARTGTPTRWRNVATVDTSGSVPITNPVGQFELVPAPDGDDLVLRIEGQAPLSPLVADTDTCIIDSKAIVLFAAAEMLAVQKSEGAPIKLQKAQNYLRKLLADQGADKRDNYNMGGRYRTSVVHAVPYIDYIP